MHNDLLSLHRRCQPPQRKRVRRQDRHTGQLALCADQKKRLLIDRQPSGAYLLPDTPSVLDAVCSLRNHNISSLDLRINQPDKEGHQHE
jgi:hypothetical protein